MRLWRPVAMDLPDSLRRPDLEIPTPSEDPFPHVLVEDFLRPEAIQPVLDALLELEYTPSDADLFYYLASPDLTDPEGPVLTALKAAFGDAAWRFQVAQAFGIEELNRTDMGAYVLPDTGYLLPHDDLVAGRQVASVLYLSPGIGTENGGRLHLFSSTDGVPEKIVKTIAPPFNSLAMFRVSKASWHSVEEVHGEEFERMTVTGWHHA